MAEALIHFLNQFGYLGVTILIALENIFPPIPSEVILTFGGFMTTYTKLTLSGVIACATAGSVIGAVVLYELGYLLTNEKLNRFLYGRLGRLLHFNRDDVEYTMDWFRKKGKYTVFFCRCVPIVRSLISIPAGMAKMPWASFLAMTAVGSAIWNIVLVSLGRLAGQSWTIISDAINTYGHILKLICLAAAAAYIFYLFFKKKKRLKSIDKK